MKAALMEAPGRTPVYGEFREPVAGEGQQIITMAASALSQLSKSRSSGQHYSSDNLFPSVPGVDGVGRTADGRRVYFALPEAPFGALAERSLVRSQLCIPVPDGLDDVTAAAIANPGMSAWAALALRARLQPGETVLVNGATGTAGRVAIQLAKYLGAGKVIATGRNAAELEELKSIGADVAIAFSLDGSTSSGPQDFETALVTEFAGGIHVVVDYLWGESAWRIMVAIAKGVEDATPVRFIHVGQASGAETIALAGAMLRSSAIVLMGSGLKSVPMPDLLGGIGKVFEAVGPAKLEIAIKTVPLAEIESTWAAAAGRPRLVYTIG